jgi:hypothetical protein
MTVATPRRRANGDEHRIGAADRLVDRSCECQSLFADIRAHKTLQTGFVNWNFAALKRSNLGGVFVDTHHVVAEIGKTRPGNEPHVTSTNHHNAHDIPSITGQFATRLP